MRLPWQKFQKQPSVFWILRTVAALPRCFAQLPSDLVGQPWLNKVQTPCARWSSDAPLHDERETDNDYSSGKPALVEDTKAIAVAENQNSVVPWRARLTTLEQFKAESSLELPSENGHCRLIDDARFAQNPELWLELIRFRRRHDGLKGSQAVFKAMLDKGFQFPIEGTIADNLWDEFIELGRWKSRGIRDEVIPYALNLLQTTGNLWPKLYPKLLLQCLRTQPETAFKQHVILYKDFHPTSGQMKQLFHQIPLSKRSLGVFRRMYIDLKTRDMYSTIIPRLCLAEEYSQAIKWHYLLLRLGDIPTNAVIAEPLLDYLTLYGTAQQLSEVNKSLVEAGVSFTSSGPATHISPLSRENMNRLLGEEHSITPKELSDSFCARIFATKMFSTGTVIQTLNAFGVRTLGPLALKELAARENSSPEIVRQYIFRLNDAEISIGDSVFSVLTQKLAMNNDPLLQDAVEHDMHPDAYEDYTLQESLLASYKRSDNRRKEELTLAILTAKTSPEDMQKARWNLLLRCAITNKDIKHAYQILELMQEQLLPVDARSSHYARTQLLSPRRRSKKPSHIDDLPIVIAIFQHILRTGGDLPALEWREIIRRLGMTGQLPAVESLALWLADWYLKPSFRRLQSSVFSLSRSRNQIPQSLSPRHEKHPLRLIFPIAAQHAIVAWGFQHCDNTASHTTSSNGSSLTWRWGVTLLAKLKERGVPVQRTDVARACRLRLVALFGLGRSSRRVNRRAQGRNFQQVEEMAAEMESLWGEELFLFDGANARDGKSRMEKLRHMAFGKAMRTRTTSGPRRRAESQWLQSSDPEPWMSSGEASTHENWGDANAQSGPLVEN